MEIVLVTYGCKEEVEIAKILTFDTKEEAAEAVKMYTKGSKDEPKKYWSAAKHIETGIEYVLDRYSITKSIYFTT